MKKTIKVYQDTDPMNPRKEWDNFGTMVCWHKRYELGDKQPKIHSNSYINDLPKRAVILPLYLYDHSGITIDTTPFSCQWDSGQVGYIYANPDTILKEFNKKRISKQMIEKVKEILRCEVKIYDQYLTGMVWGYEIEDEDGVDSCWGFYGTTLDETGMKEHVDKELHDDLEEAFDNPTYGG